LARLMKEFPGKDYYFLADADTLVFPDTLDAMTTLLEKEVLSKDEDLYMGDVQCYQDQCHGTSCPCKNPFVASGGGVLLRGKTMRKLKKSGKLALEYAGHQNASAARAAALTALAATGACGLVEPPQPPTAAVDAREGLLAKLNTTAGVAGTIVRERERAWRYYAALLHARFVAAPAGAGRDTYRMYEAIVLGAIPVMRRSVAELARDRSKLEGLPVLVVSEWDEATPQRLLQAWEAIYRNASFDARRAHLPFWLHALLRPGSHERASVEDA